MPKVSVVIPCYNHGKYLGEAVDSVLNQTFADFEIVIVDDGSDDPETKNLLAQLDRPKTKVIHTENAGLASARNNGIRASAGEYILPLDADDKIGKEYLEEAVPILDRNAGIGVVYCQAAYFGERDGLVDLPVFSMERILKKNIIFCSALFRKKHWEQVGGYNENMVYGLEDWDFWLSLLEMGLKVHRIPKTLFFYRIRKASMLSTISEENQFFMIKNVIFNHRSLFRDCAEIYIVPKVSQLYVDTGSGFNDRQVISRVVFREEKRVEFDVSDFEQIRGLRFDPINDACLVRIGRIEATLRDGSRVRVKPLGDNAIHREGPDFIFSTRDPQIHLEVPEGEIQGLCVDLDYIAIGKNAFERILDFQAEAIARNRGELERLKNEIGRIRLAEQQLAGLRRDLEKSEARYEEVVRSTSWKLSYPLRWVFGRMNRTSAAVLRNQESSMLNELLFLYHCYAKKSLVPPPRFNFVGSAEFFATGKMYHDLILRFCILKGDEALLDIGCGIGRVAIHFTGFIKGKGRYEGFDIVNKGIRWCRHKISRLHPSFTFKHADIYSKEYNPKGTLLAVDFKFPYPDEAFDVAFATSVFTHMLPEACLNYLHEIRRVLKNGTGRALVSAFVLNEDSRKNMANGAFDFKKTDDRYGVMVEENPEAAIAYEEAYLKEMIGQARLRIAGPIHFGNWSTRASEIHGQDILILEKA